MRALEVRAGRCQTGAMREKELRLALVCYGGISLAVYMHGITREVWKLLRASRAVLAGEPPPEGDTERVYHELLSRARPDLELRVLVDIVAGASAGGINGIFLSQAISSGQSLDPLVDLWLEKADIDELLDPEAVPRSSFTKFYAQPLLRLLTHDRSVDLTQEVVEAGARRELRQKLSRFVRSRWFKPPFSGSRFSGFLLDAFEAMGMSNAGPPLLPDGQPLDLFVTVTDFYGFEQPLRLNSPPEVTEIEHRKVVAFRDEGRRGSFRQIASSPSLAAAARATASFPGAFPPFQVSEMDKLLAEREQAWDGRGIFLASLFPNRGPDDARESVPLLDGSILNNAPFGPCLSALRNRPAHREIDRRFVYIDPKPGIRSISVTRKDPEGPPGFFTTILQSLADIPREQPIRDDLEALDARSMRVRRMRRVLRGIADATDSEINAALGTRTLGAKPAPARLRTLRAQANASAVDRAGFAYSGYAHLKLADVTGTMTRVFAGLGGARPPAGEAKVRAAVLAWVRRERADEITRTAKPRQAARNRYVRFLTRFDTGYRIRRLRYVIRKLSDLVAETEDESARASGERAKAALFELLGPFLDRRSSGFAADALRPLVGDVAKDVDKLAARYADELDLPALDIETDRRLSVILRSPGTAAEVRRAIMRAYLGFPFYDIATFPMLQGEGLDEYDEIKIDRIAPDDATFLREGGAEATLKGIRFNSFGAFFSRAYRENDYLWGRLHGAERLIEIVLSALPSDALPPAEEMEAMKRAALSAILDAEEERLTAIPDLIEQLRAELAAGR